MNFRHLVVTLGCLLLAGSASATTITGSANIGGTVTVTNTSILFNPVTGLPSPGATETGSFAGFTNGTIKTLTGPPFSGAISVPQFATFNVAGVSPVYFDLQVLDPGKGTAAGCTTVGTNCTPTPDSPFNLVQIGNGVSASISMSGIGYTGTAATGFTPTTGIFTAQFNFTGVTLVTLLNQLAMGNYTNTTGVTYSATFTANPTPEPSAASLLFAGVALIAGSRVIRRYRQQS